MKAVVITKPGGPDVLRVQEIDPPLLSDHEVLIDVRAAGVNRPDISQRKGNYPAPPGVPSDIPGLEVAGIITRCGESVTRWKSGDRVCALLGGAGYAEFAAVSEHHCLPIPSGLNFEQAASLPETVFTVWHNLFERGQLKEGEHVLIHGGSSGIGITGIQIARSRGAKVTVTAGSDDKCKACLDLGANTAINYKQEDFESVLRNDRIDVILDMVGGDYISKNMNLLKEDGRLVFINAMKGGHAEWNATDIMRRRLTITGSTLRIRDHNFKARLAGSVYENVWPLLESGQFRPVIYKTFHFEEANEAHRLMESSAHIGKIVLSFP